MSEESIKLNGFSEIQRIFSKDNLEISEEEFALLFENSLEDGETTLNIDKFVQDVVENYKLDSGDELYEVISKLAENDGNSETLSLEDLKYEEDAGNEEENKFDESALDKSEWQLVETKSDKVLGFLWNSGTYTYKTSNGTEITVSDTTDVKIYENTKTGEVIVAGAKGAKITGSSSGSNLIIYDSDIESIDTGKASDNIKIYNSSVGNLSTGKGTDSITIEDSEVGKINTGSGNDFVSVADSTVSNVNTSSNFLFGILDDGEDTVILNDTQTEGVKTGRGSDNVLVTNASVNTLDAGGGSNSLSIEETDIENIKTNKNDTIVNDNNYIDIDKDIILGIESDSQIMLEDGTSISVSDYTDYMLSQEVGFETEKEYQEYVLQAMSANLESIKSTFNTQEASDGVVSEGYNLLKELTGLGITNDEIQTLIAEQEAMIEGLTAALNGESSMTFEEAYEYYTGTTYSKEKIDKYMEVSQIYSAVMVGCQYDEDYIDKFEEATGKSIEDISKEYALCQMETFGRSTGIQDLVEKYAEDQNSFADKLSMAISTVGITCIVAGAVVSFVFPPAAPVGIALMTAGKYISLSGMFVDNAMDLVNDSTDSDGLTKEEIGDIALETGVEAVSYMAGRGIGKLTSGVVNPFVTNKAASAGIGKVGQYVLGQTAETTADAALSLGTDFVIAQGQSIITTGQFMDADDYWSMDRLLGEGKNQLIGILTGLSSSKVNAYQQGIISTAQGKILSSDIEGAKDYLRSTGMKMSDSDFDGFVEQVRIVDSESKTAVGTETHPKGITSEVEETSVLRTDSTDKLEAKSLETEAYSETRTDASETTAPVSPYKNLITKIDGKLYLEDMEMTDYDEATGIYRGIKFGKVYEYRSNEGLLSEYKKQGKPGFEVSKLSQQIVFDYDGNPIEIRMKIKTDQNGNITSYKTYNSDGTKIINTKDFYPGGTAVKKLTLYDDSPMPAVTEELTYRQNGTLNIKKEYEAGNIKFETEYKEDGITILSKKIYNGYAYTQQKFDDEGRVKTESQHNVNKQKLSSTEFEYGDNGKIKLQTKYDAKGNKLSTSEFEYGSDDKIKLKVETTYSGNMKVSSIEFQFDEDGNIISQIKTEYNIDGTIKNVQNSGAIPKVDTSVLYQKIQGQLGNVYEEDVERMINTLQSNGATREEATYALSILTQFGNVKGLSEALSDSTLNINGFEKQKIIDTNSALNYFCGNKKQIVLNGSKTGFILDSNSLEYLESLSPTDLQAFLNRTDIQFINLEGWDVGTNVYNQGMDSTLMTTKATELISQAKTIQEQSGINFEEAFRQAVNSATLERATQLGITDIKTVSALKDTSVSSDTVVKNLSSLSISEEKIEATADAISKTLYSDVFDQTKAKELIVRYLESQADIYSPQRLGEQMIKIRGQIEENIKNFKKADGSSYTMDDVYYLVPYAGKSYEQVLLQYKTLNDVDSSHIIYSSADNADLPDGRIYVAFDDIVGSGSSMLSQSDGVKYSGISEYGDRHFILAPIISSSEGAKRIVDEISLKGRTGQDILLVDKSNTIVVLEQSDFYKSLSAEEQTMLYQIIDVFNSGTWGSKGFGNKALSVIFPYMAPDNDAQITSVFFEDLFLRPEECIKNFYNKSDPIIQRILQSIKSIT